MIWRSATPFVPQGVPPKLDNLLFYRRLAVAAMVEAGQRFLGRFGGAFWATAAAGHASAFCPPNDRVRQVAACQQHDEGRQQVLPSDGHGISVAIEITEYRLAVFSVPLVNLPFGLKRQSTFPTDTSPARRHRPGWSCRRT